MAMNRHVHRRSDGIAVICTGACCAPSRTSEIAWRALLVAGPAAVVAASGALGLEWSSRLALALLAFAGLLAWWAARVTDAPLVERDARAADAPLDRAARR
jgi:hypothetical protein